VVALKQHYPKMAGIGKRITLDRTNYYQFASVTVITSLQTFDKWLYSTAPSNGEPSVTPQVCLREEEVVGTQNPSSSSTNTVKSGCDKFARRDTFGNPFSLIAVKPVTWVRVRCSLGYLCWDHIGDKAQAKALHLRGVS